MSTVYKFKAFFTKAGIGTAPSSAPVCTLINMADDSKLADAQACTASTNMPGLYSYSYNGNDGLDVVALFHTTDTTMDQQDLGSYVSEKITTNLNAPIQTIDDQVDTLIARLTALRAGYLDNLSAGAVAQEASVSAIPTTPLLADDARLDNLDAAVSSRLASAGYTTPPTVGEIATAVWEYTTRTLSSFGTLIASIWTYGTRTLTSAGAGGATAQEVWEYADRTITGQSAEVEVTGPVASGGGISIIAGDDYYDADGRALEWSSEAWPDLTGASVVFKTGDTEIDMDVVVSGGGEQSVRLELSAEETVELKGSFTFDVDAVLAGVAAHEVTLVRAAGVCG